jgi:mannose-1-phosphate guanylyltransferase/phosphomannomutase
MAAGAGTRLRPLTDAVPKPMVTIANKPVLEYTIENLKRHGITEIILNLHNHPELIRDYFKDGSAWGVQIQYSHEPKLLGTAGGVKKVEDFLKQGTFLVMSGDGLTTIDLTRLLAFHKRKKALATMGIKPVDTRFDYGVTMVSAAGRITRFIEKPMWSDVFSNEVNTGIYVFEPEALQFIPKRKPYDFGHDLWPLLLKKRKPIFGYPMKEYWCDVGNLSEYRRAQRDALDGKAGIPLPGKQMKPGVWVEEGAHIDPDAALEAPCLVGQGAHIERGAVIGPYTIIGRHAHIAAGSVIKHSILWNHVQIVPQVKLENCILTDGTRITEPISLTNAEVIPTPN